MKRRRRITGKSKLRVFDLTDVHQDFWNPGAGTHEGDYLPQVERQKQSVEICPNSGVKKRFNVVTDLEIRKAKFKKCDKYVLQWVRRRKRSVHLCCRMLKILDSSVSTATLIFKKINLSCVLELWLSQWSLEFLAQLLPYLEKMRNLHTLALNGVWKPLGFAAATEQEWISMLLSQISKLHCLQNLSVYNVYFITGCLEEWLSSRWFGWDNDDPIQMDAFKGLHMLQKVFLYSPGYTETHSITRLALNSEIPLFHVSKSVYISVSLSVRIKAREERCPTLLG
ncbi:hypothetical protein STEG23_007061 [Scotinomys teguina]